MDIDLDPEHKVENKRLSGISFRSGAYRKSTDRAPTASQLELSKKRKNKARKRSEVQDVSKLGGFTRRLSKILSVGDKIGEKASSYDTTPMISEGKTLGLKGNVENSVTPAPLKKGYTRKGLREKQSNE